MVHMVHCSMTQLASMSMLIKPRSDPMTADMSGSGCGAGKQGGMVFLLRHASKQCQGAHLRLLA